jgi:hypothetical protein
MVTFKSSVTLITAGIVAFLGLEAYGFYSIRRSLETRLGQIESGIESVRAEDAAIRQSIASQPTAIASQPAKSQPVVQKPKAARPTVWNDQIAANRKLAAKLQKMLPAGTNLKQASSGFKNEKEFISAVYASKNLGIPFAQLKAKVIGKHAITLDAAIRELRPDLGKAKAKTEEAKAEREATETMKLG